MISKSTKGKITLESIQAENGIKQSFVQSAECSVFEKADELYIFYRESEDTLASDVKSKIKISSDEVNIVRKGTYSSNILFKENQECKFVYHMPYGKINMSVKTKKADVIINDEEILIKLKYDLFNGENNLESRMNIIIEKVI